MPEHATVTRPRHVRPRPPAPGLRALAPPAPRRSRDPASPRPHGRVRALSRLPDHRVVDRLLRSRACIWVIGLMLGGIVAMQVSLLRLNAGISRAVQTQSTLELQNPALQAAIASSRPAIACATPPPSSR